MRDKTNLYAYTHKHKKHGMRRHEYHNKHNSAVLFNNDDNAVAVNNGTGMRSGASQTLHDITLKMRRMYDAVAESFKSFNAPSKPFVAINYNQIHNGWKYKKNRGRMGMNRMKMKTVISGGTPCINDNPSSSFSNYELIVNEIKPEPTSKNISVIIRKKDPTDFEAFVESLAEGDGGDDVIDDGGGVSSASPQLSSVSGAGDGPGVNVIRGVSVATQTGQTEDQIDNTVPIEDDEDAIFIKAAALTASAVALAIASNSNQGPNDDDDDETFIKAAALTAAATAMAIAHENGKK
jgi:hypothetical protein